MKNCQPGHFCPGDDGTSAYSWSDAIAMVRRRAWLIGAITVAAVALSVAVAALLPNQYKGVATVLIDARKKTVTDVGKVVDGLRVNTPAVESQVEIAASNGVTLAVIERLKLRRDAEFASSLGAQKPGPAQADKVLDEVRSRLKVRRVRNTHLIELAFTSRSAEKAARIATAYAESFVAHELEQKIRQGRLASALLAKKLDSLRARLTAAEYKVERFKALNDIFDAEGQLLSEKKLARLMEQTVVARNNTAKAGSRFEHIKRIIGGGYAMGTIGDVLESHTVRMLKDRHAKLTGRAAELAIKYGPKHPAMQKVRAEVRDIEAQIKAEIERIVFNQKNEYDVARAREKTLVVDLRGLKRQQIKEKEASVGLKQLEREASTSRELYEAILGRYKQTAATQAMQLPDLRVAEAAAVPMRPSSPKRLQLVALGSLAGMVLALGLAFVLDFSAGALRRRDEKDGVPALEHLASLPMLEPVGGEDVEALHAIRQMIAEPNGAFAKAIASVGHGLDARRRAGAAADHGSSQGKTSCIIQVVSALPLEGRTMVASNLAHHYAMSGSRTLLIDADLRRAGLTRELAPGARAGLLDCIAAGVRPQLAVLRDARTGLSFLPARGGVAVQLSAPGALGSPRVRRALHQFRDQFEIIVIDCPPILPVTDARIIADHADQILFVMASQRTPKELARLAVGSLGCNREKIAGVVVNQIEAAAHGAQRAVGSDGNVVSSDSVAQAA